MTPKDGHPVKATSHGINLKKTKTLKKNKTIKDIAIKQYLIYREKRLLYIIYMYLLTLE